MRRVNEGRHPHRTGQDNFQGAIVVHCLHSATCPIRRSQSTKNDEHRCGCPCAQNNSASGTSSASIAIDATTLVALLGGGPGAAVVEGGLGAAVVGVVLASEKNSLITLARTQFCEEVYSATLVQLWHAMLEQLRTTANDQSALFDSAATETNSWSCGSCTHTPESSDTLVVPLGEAHDDNVALLREV